MINFIIFIYLLIIILIFFSQECYENFTVFVPSYSPYRIYYPLNMLYPFYSSPYNYLFPSQYFNPYAIPWAPYYGRWY